MLGTLLFLTRWICSGGRVGSWVQTPEGGGMVIGTGQGWAVVLMAETGAARLFPSRTTHQVRPGDLTDADRSWLEASRSELRRWQPCWVTNSCTVRS